jgi:hypothetical protein
MKPSIFGFGYNNKASRFRNLPEPALKLLEQHAGNK